MPVLRISHRPLPIHRHGLSWSAVITLLLCLFSGSVTATDRPIRFTNLTEIDGLTSAGVTGITQDHSGIMWFSTKSGLYKYDGYELTLHKHDPSDPASISGNNLTALCLSTAYGERASSEKLWVGTSYRGLNCFDPFTEKAEHFERDASDPHSLSSNNITALMEDRQGRLWVGTQSGLNLFRPQEKSFHRFLASSGEDSSLQNDSITALEEDQHGVLWIGTIDGTLSTFNDAEGSFTVQHQFGSTITSLYESRDGMMWIATAGHSLSWRDPSTQTIATFPFDPTNSEGISSRTVYSVFEDSRNASPMTQRKRKAVGQQDAIPTTGNLWIGTAAGVDLYDRQKKRFIHFSHNPSDPSSLVGNSIRSIFEDERNVLWLGSHQGGISRFYLYRKWFAHVQQSENLTNSLSSNSVWDLRVDSFGLLWIGTESGVNVYNRSTDQYTVYRNDASDPTSLSHDYASALLEDRFRNMWVGTRGGGLSVYNRLSGEFKTYPNDPDDPNSLGSDSVNVLCEDRMKTLWVGTTGAGLARFDPVNQNFFHYRHSAEDPWSISSDYVTEIVDDPEHDALWIGTMGGGMNRFDRRSGQFIRYQHTQGKPKGISGNHITSIHRDPEGILWIGTLGDGLNRFDPALNSFTYFNEANSQLPHGDVTSVEGDMEGHLWISTGNGLARMDRDSSTFRLFDMEDGLQSMIFHEKASHLDADGRLYFGGPNGFNIIDPKNLSTPPDPPAAVLTGVEINGERLVPRPNSMLPRPISAMESITIPHNPRQRFSLSFSTLQYTMPSRSRFRYRLQGVDGNWTYAGSDRRATYTNLVPGHYYFYVQASLDGEQWSEQPNPLKVIITPPWHQTWWARLIAMFSTIGTVAGIFAIRIRHHQQKSLRREEQLEAERTQAQADLAHQLQQGMLLQKTTEQFQRDLNAKDIFQAAIQQLGEHFKASRCYVRILVTEPQYDLPILAEHIIGPYESAENLTLPTTDNILLQKLLESDRALPITDVTAGPLLASIRWVMDRLQVKSVLGVRTAFQGDANGLIILEQCDERREWNPDEVRLIEAVASQIGIAIAQVKLTMIEERQRRQLETAMRAAEVASKAKSAFLAKMTHELRTPLSSILGFCEMLTVDPSTTSGQREILHIINQSGEHLLSIINDVLDMSKIESGRVTLENQPCDLHKLISIVHEMLAFKARSEGLEFHTYSLSDLPQWVSVDVAKLRQILINLLGNAIKFTREGHVSLSVSCIDLTEGLLSEFDSTGFSDPVALQFSVEDTGAGISEEELPHLFGEFVQAEAGRQSQRGTGLGLAISQRFVEMMGGKITVESRLREGTIFRFHVVCDRIQLSTKDLAISKNSPTIKRLVPEDHSFYRILVAEDQQANRLLLVTLLRRAGFDVAEAVNGREAVDLCFSWHPHLIFMDNDMPVMTGEQAIREIRRHTSPAEPVIVSLTASALEETRTMSFAAGCNEFMTKPYQHEDLFQTIARHLPVSYLYQDALPAVAPPRDALVAI